MQVYPVFTKKTDDHLSYSTTPVLDIICLTEKDANSRVTFLQAQANADQTIWKERRGLLAYEKATETAIGYAIGKAIDYLQYGENKDHQKQDALNSLLKAESIISIKV